MHTYAFITTDNCRVDVKATTAKAAWNKLQSIPSLKRQVTRAHFRYDSDGFSDIHKPYEYIDDKGGGNAAGE